MDEDVKNLKSVLLDDKDSVICIIDVTGASKIALAHKLYDDPDVQNHFNFRFAIEIGRPFAVRNALQSILE